MKSKPAKKVIHADFPARCPQVTCWRLYTYIGPPFCWRFSVHFDPRSSQQLPTKKGSMPGIAGTRSDQSGCVFFCFFSAWFYGHLQTRVLLTYQIREVSPPGFRGIFVSPSRSCTHRKMGSKLDHENNWGGWFCRVYFGEMQIISFYN